MKWPHCDSRPRFLVYLWELRPESAHTALLSVAALETSLLLVSRAATELATCQEPCEHHQVLVLKTALIWGQSSSSTPDVNGRYFCVFFKYINSSYTNPSSLLPDHFLSELACLIPTSLPHHGHILEGVGLLRIPAAFGVTPDFYLRCPL